MESRYCKKVIAMAKVAHPVEVPTPADWEQLEGVLRVQLPRDYKHLVSTIGNGTFGEFSLFNPISSSEYTRFTLEDTLWFRKYVGRIAAEAGLLLYPEEGGYIRIGCADRVDLLIMLQDSCGGRYRLRVLEQNAGRAYAPCSDICRFLWELYHGTLSEEWAADMRDRIWTSGERFFKPWPSRASDEAREATIE